MRYKKIRGWCNFEDIYTEMVHKASNGYHFVEIGTFFGKSAVLMGELIASSGKDITFDTIDHFKGSPLERDGKHKVCVDQDVEKIARLNCAGLPVNIITGDSIKLSRRYKKESLDFVFIDGSHDYNDVLRDIRVWSKKVKKGGFIGGHDYDNPNVYQAVQKILNVDCPKGATSWLCQV